VVLGWGAQTAVAAKPCDVPVTASFRDDGADSVRSDGGEYIDGRDRVNSDIACDGDYYFLSGTRTLVFDLALISSSPVNAGGNFAVEVGLDGGLLGMSNDQPVQTTKVQFNFVVGPTRYFLAFWQDRYPDTHDINVTRLDNNTWVVEAPSTATAKLLSCSAKGKCNQVEVGNTAAPFKLTLVRQ